jgi:hypothetical protein
MTLKQISPLQKHGSHIMKLVHGPIQTKKPGLVHAGKFMCVKCNKLLKWATQSEVDFYQHRYSGVTTTYQGFVDRYFNHTHKPEPTTSNEQIIYLVCTYQDKDQVKSFGAKWDEFHRLWYVKTSNPHLEKLKKWIHVNDYERCGFKQIIPEPIDTSLPGGKLKALLNGLMLKKTSQ